MSVFVFVFFFFCFKQKTAYEMRISDWSSDVCSSDLARDKSWSAKVNAPMKRNFGQSSYKLNLATEVLKPGEYLKRAKDQLDKIDLDSEGLLSAAENEALAVEIGRIAFNIKKRFDRRVSK